MCTRTGAELQQVCTKNNSLIHALLVWHSSVPGAQRCSFRMSPQKIGNKLSFPATCRALPMTEQSSGTRVFLNFELCSAVTVTLKACLRSRSGELEHTLA